MLLRLEPLCSLGLELLWACAMKKQLTEAQFLDVIQGMDVGDQTVQIARGVLVEGRPQADYVRLFGVTPGAVSQAVNRVWTAHQEKSLPKGFKKVEAVLPEHQAFIVNKWAQDAAKRQEKP